MTESDPAGLVGDAAQAERTALSWQRTAVGIVAAGALAVHWAAVANLPAWPGAALIAIGGFAGVVLVRRRYARVIQTVRAGQTPVSRYLVPATAAFMVAVVTAAAVGIVVEMTRL
jgi:uncharacterized membrane protein YidH (DUF202 family)